MTGVARSEVAAKTQLRRLNLPESRAGDQTVLAVGDIAAVASRNAGAVEIRKALNL